MKRERLLAILIVMFAFLSIIDTNFPARSLGYIDLESISLIISFMLVSKLLSVSGAFSKLSSWILSRGGNVAIFLLLLMAELGAALLMNDTSLFFMIPLVIIISKISGCELRDLAVLVTIAANIGSALTPFGNPQNIIIWRHYHITILNFMLEMTPFFLISTGILLIFALMENLSLRKVKIPTVRLDMKLAISALVILSLNLVLAQIGLYWMGLLISLIASSILRREVLLKIDIPLIIIFCLLFMDFGELSYLIGVWRVIPPITGFEIVLTSSIISQLMSNVPATITLLNHISNWRALAIGVNLGGTGFITGSMANIITLRLTKIDLKKFHEVSIPYFLALLSCFLLLSYLSIYP